MTSDVLKTGLPANVEAERFVLGSVLLSGGDLYPEVAASITPVDLVLEKHRRILARMGDLHARGEKIEYLTLADELMKQGQLESVDGAAYISSLTEGLPRLENIDSYIRVIREKTARRRLIYTAHRLVNEAGTVDLDELLAGTETALHEIGQGLADQYEFQQPGEVIEATGGMQRFFSPQPGLATPWPKVTEVTCGLHQGDLSLLAARPSVGKTAAALQVAYHVTSKLSKGVAFFSLEMSKESLVRRLASVVAGVNQHALRLGRVGDEERRAVSAATNSLARIPLFLSDRSTGTVMAVHASIRRLRARHNISLVIIDYLQLMSGAGENRNVEVSAISRSLKLMARELNIPFLVLSQLNRAVETRAGGGAPQLHDLRDSGSLEQDADTVIFLHRPEMHRLDGNPALAEFIIAKQRNGPVGKINMVFLEKIGRFEVRQEE